ncbi:MAG: hypothetical protein R2857_03150 [Vampirovibrionales bacterium]
MHDTRITVDFNKGHRRYQYPGCCDRGPAGRMFAVGERNVMPLQFTNMGAEDFGYYLQHVPGCYMRFGAQIEGKEGFPAHFSKFDFDEQAFLIWCGLLPPGGTGGSPSLA